MAQSRELTYGDEAMIRHINEAADHLKSAIIQTVVDKSYRAAAPLPVIQLTITS
jgi:hypothetical protein